MNARYRKPLLWGAGLIAGGTLAILAVRHFGGDAAPAAPVAAAAQAQPAAAEPQAAQAGADTPPWMQAEEPAAAGTAMQRAAAAAPPAAAATDIGRSLADIRLKSGNNMRMADDLLAQLDQLEKAGKAPPPPGRSAVNVLVVSPHFPPNFQNFARSLRAAGATVLGLADAPPESLPAGLREVLAECAFVPDLRDADAVLRAVAGLISRHGRLHRVESHTEHWLELDARLREDFNIPGQRPADLRLNRRKSAMKRRFQEAGIPCADGVPADCPRDVRALAARAGFPLVLKPDVGVGAAGAFRVADADALEAALPGPRPDLFAEATLTGGLVSFDGLADRHGTPVFWTSHRFSAPILEVVEKGLPLHYWSVRDIPPRLEDLGRRAVAAFGIRERFFHIEFFHGPDGEYRALEINVRPPGGYTMDRMNFSADVDVYRWWADVALGAPRSFDFTRRYGVAHASRRRGAAYRYAPDELMARHGDLVVAHLELPAAFATVMGDEAWLLRHPDAERLQAAIADVDAAP